MLRLSSPRSTVASAPAADTPVRHIIRWRTCCGPACSSILDIAGALDHDVGLHGCLAKVPAVEIRGPEAADHIGAICARPARQLPKFAAANIRRTLESGHTIPGGCEGSSSWTCSRAGSPGQREGQRRNDKGNRGSCRRRRCSRERVHDRATRPEKRHHGHAKTAPEYRRYTGDRRSLKPFGPYNARYTGDHRSIFRKRYAEMITRVSLQVARPEAGRHPAKHVRRAQQR